MSCVPRGVCCASFGTEASYRPPRGRLRSLRARLPRQYPVRVVHRVDALHGTEDRLEMARVGELEVEAQLGDPIARRLRRAGEDVDVMLRQRLGDVAQQAG